MKIVTWNVNSVRSRLTHLVEWLHNDAPDIVLLQELKVINELFPASEIEALGYNIALNGQKTYNGVAILSKFPLEDVKTFLPGEDTDQEARYIEAVASGKDFALRVASVYVPNGQSPDSDKFLYKLRFLERLFSYNQALLELEEMIIIGGDYNVAPAAMDVYNAKELDGTVCFHPLERHAFRSLANLGFYDAFRVVNPEKKSFSWWDYRGNGFIANKGLRIDHLMVSPQAADKLISCTILDKLRALVKPSDHAPVIATFAI